MYHRATTGAISRTADRANRGKMALFDFSASHVKYAEPSIEGLTMTNKAELQGRWLHAHEEDSGDSLVFRPATYELPPARGRTGYEFQDDGRLTVVGPGPTDRTATRSGTWSVSDDRQLTIRVPGQPEQVFEITTLDADRLGLKKA